MSNTGSINNFSIFSQLMINRPTGNQNISIKSFDNNTVLAQPASLFNTQFNIPRSGNSPSLYDLFGDNNGNTSVQNKSQINEEIKGKVVGTAKGTGYYPFNSRMEGGYVDKKGHKLCTLQDFLSGKAPYVSIALDKNLYKKGVIKYGDKFRIPELEKKYGRKIEFRAVDTGGAFTNKGFGRVDICTGSKKDSIDKTINGKLTLIKAD